MAKPSDRSPERKLQVVLSVLRGELSVKEAARRAGVAEQTVHNWKRALLDAGREGLAQGHRRRSSRELECEAENEELKAALGEAHVQLRVWKKGASISLRRGPRHDPHRVWLQRLEVRGVGGGAPPHLSRGGVIKGPWPAPVVDRIEPDVAKYAEAWPAWGLPQDRGDRRRRRSRRGLALQCQAGHGPPRSVAAGTISGRAPPARRRTPGGLRGPACAPQPRLAGGLHPVRDHRRGHLAAVPGGGLRHQGRAGVPDHTHPGRQPTSSPHCSAPSMPPRRCWAAPSPQDCTDPATGEIHPLVIVTDNGPAMKSVAVARWFAARSHLAHVRTRHPHTNGVVERWIESLKYERLYRYDIASGIELADHVTAFTDEYNTIRPHQALDQTPPLTAYLNDRTLKPNPPRNEQDS